MDGGGQHIGRDLDRDGAHAALGQPLERILDRGGNAAGRAHQRMGTHQPRQDPGLVGQFMQLSKPAADPGLDALREALPLPVVGPLISACHAASMLGNRFSVVMPAGNPRMTRQRVLGYGFGDKLVSVRQVNRPVLELRANLPDTIARFAAEIEAAVAEGADSVILGCMALFGVAAQIPAAVPVVDPALAALTSAEAMVRMGLNNSQKPALAA